MIDVDCLFAGVLKVPSSEGLPDGRPDAQKVARLFGQAIWTTKHLIIS